MRDREQPTDSATVELRIEGMDCAEEVAVLTRELAQMVGGEENLAFDLLNAKLIATLPPGCSGEDVVAAIRKTGMRAVPFVETESEPESVRRWSIHSLLTVLSGSALAFGIFIQVVSAGGGADVFGDGSSELPQIATLLSRALYLLGIGSGLALVGPKAWFSARRLRPDMNLLMTIAVVGALVIDEWFEAAAVSFLFALSLELEAWSLERARRAVSMLMELAPASVLLVAEDGTRAETSPDDVRPGATFLVRPGDRIALDGEVLEGESAVDQSPITGESLPAAKSVGDEVFAGTVNGQGALVVRSTKASDDTTLARTIRLVSQAHSRRAPSEQWVARFASVYTPAVMGLALALFAMPVLLGAPAGPWLYRALVLLVIACPCALVISTPVSIVSGLASAARNGVLIKGGVFLEAPAHIRAIAFDKTGTLTLGQPRVQQVVACDGHTVEEVLGRAAAMEAQSTHPLARAITGHAAERGLIVEPASGLQLIPGKGASATIAGRSHWIGSHRLLEERQQETPGVHAQIEELSGVGHSVVVLGNDQHVCGFLSLADELRPEARNILNDLRSAGITRLVMLTGDNNATGRAIAEMAGIDEVHCGLLPEDKVAHIAELAKRCGSIAMVGDGVNDAPAMAAASLGIAMGAAGSDAAIETADIALMADDLTRLPWLVQHSQRTLRIIRANVALSLGIKAIFVVLAVLGTASLWTAIAADMGASLVVTFNGLRLLRAS